MNGSYDLESINRSPETEWASARASAMAAFTAGGSFGGYQNGAWVGAIYNAAGAPRATCCLYGALVHAVPPEACSDARIACSQTAQVGVFTASPSGTQMLDAYEFTPSSGYIYLSIFVDIINVCAASSAQCYISVARLQPSSPSYYLTQCHYTNSTEHEMEVQGFTLAPGETLYWKVGGVDLPSYSPTITSLQLYY